MWWLLLSVTGGLYRLCSLSIALTSSYPPARSHPDGFPYIMWHDSITHKRRISFLLNRRGCGINQLPATELTHFGEERGDRLLCVCTTYAPLLLQWHNSLFGRKHLHLTALTRARRHTKGSSPSSSKVFFSLSLWCNFPKEKSQVYISYIPHHENILSIDCWTLLSYTYIYISGYV